jgi:hypothetical protein
MKSITDFYTDFLPPILSDHKRSLQEGVSVKPPVIKAETVTLIDGGDRMMRQPILLVEADVSYVDVQAIGVMGRAFDETTGYYTRLPKTAKGVVRDDVWSLSQMSTGMFVPFITDSPALSLNYTLADAPNPLWHMPSSGMHGADLFRFDPQTQTYRFVSCLTQYPDAGVPGVYTLTDGLPDQKGKPARYLLFLPLRNTVTRASLGVVSGYMDVTRDTAYSVDSVTINAKKPIVWYGTSIDQGGVASRPGATYTNILSRNLGRMVLNFGFAGNGEMELSVAQFLTQIDAEVIVIDCLPNMNAAEVTARTVPLVKFFRQKHPTTRIVLAAGTTYGDHWLFPAPNDAKRAALKAEYDALVQAGDNNLSLVLNEHDELFNGDELVNPTVGGTHPSDLGHRYIANFYTQYFTQLLANEIG